MLDVKMFLLGFNRWAGKPKVLYGWGLFQQTLQTRPSNKVKSLTAAWCSPYRWHWWQRWWQLCFGSGSVPPESGKKSHHQRGNDSSTPQLPERRASVKQALPKVIGSPRHRCLRPSLKETNHPKCKTRNETHPMNKVSGGFGAFPLKNWCALLTVEEGPRNVQDS